MYAMWHKYTHAIVAKVKPAIGVTERLDLHDARRQHDCYVRVLKELNLEVLEMDIIESTFPDNVFLEDAAIIRHGTALLPRPTNALDVIKTRVLKEVLKTDLGHTVIEVTDPNTKIVGSDVLFTGREFFVGISESTNEAGACALAQAFPEFTCTPIKLPRGGHNLKKYITMAGPDIFCVGASQEAKDLLRTMEREASFTYLTLPMEEDDAANCVFVNGTLIHRAVEEIPESFRVYCERIDYARRSIYFSELAKISTGLSACCLLIRKH